MSDQINLLVTHCVAGVGKQLLDECVSIQRNSYGRL